MQTQDEELWEPKDGKLRELVKFQKVELLKDQTVEDTSFKDSFKSLNEMLINGFADTSRMVSRRLSVSKLWIQVWNKKLRSVLHEKIATDTGVSLSEAMVGENSEEHSENINIRSRSIFFQCWSLLQMKKN